MSDVFLIIAISVLWPVVIMLLFRWAYMKDMKEFILALKNAQPRTPTVRAVGSVFDLDHLEPRAKGDLAVIPDNSSMWLFDGSKWHKVADEVEQETK